MKLLNKRKNESGAHGNDSTSLIQTPSVTYCNANVKNKKPYSQKDSKRTKSAKDRHVLKFPINMNDIRLYLMALNEMVFRHTFKKQCISVKQAKKELAKLSRLKEKCQNPADVKQVWEKLRSQFNSILENEDSSTESDISATCNKASSNKVFLSEPINDSHINNETNFTVDCQVIDCNTDDNDDCPIVQDVINSEIIPTKAIATPNIDFKNYNEAIREKSLNSPNVSDTNYSQVFETDNIEVNMDYMTKNVSQTYEDAFECLIKNQSDKNIHPIFSNEILKVTNVLDKSEKNNISQIDIQNIQYVPTAHTSVEILESQIDFAESPGVIQNSQPIVTTVNARRRGRGRTKSNSVVNSSNVNKTRTYTKKKFKRTNEMQHPLITPSLGQKENQNFVENPRNHSLDIADIDTEKLTNVVDNMFFTENLQIDDLTEDIAKLFSSESQQTSLQDANRNYDKLDNTQPVIGDTELSKYNSYEWLKNIHRVAIDYKDYGQAVSDDDVDWFKDFD